jgi:hypothetical protein
MRSRTSHAAKSGVGEHTARESECAQRMGINGSLKDNRPNNLRALCPECFKLVAKKENRKGMVGNIRYAFGRMIK